MLAERPRARPRAHPRHAAGAHRRTHRPAARRAEARAAARVGDRSHLLAGALAHISPEIDDVDSLHRGAAAPRPRRARDARDDSRRAGVQVQARADPRGRLLGALEERPRRSAPRIRRVAARARGRRAARDPRVPPRPGVDAPRRARRRRAGRAARGDGGRAHARRQARALARGVPQRAQAARCAPSSSRRRSTAAISPAVRRGGSPTSPPCSSRWARSRTRPRAAGETRCRAARSRRSPRRCSSIAPTR